MRGNYTTKTIYVKEEDLPLYNEATKVGGSLSSTIAEALREYVGKHYVSKLREGRQEAGR